MTKGQFSRGRRHLGKTQKQMAQLLGTSLKAIQSFEQGWRKIPVHIERQLLLLLALKRSGNSRNRQVCWEMNDCPPETRGNCPAWEFDAGHLCWMINGTICRGEAQKNWQKKMAICKKCKVFRSLSSPL